jgi:hypothetical protein
LADTPCDRPWGRIFPFQHPHNFGVHASPVTLGISFDPIPKAWWQSNLETFSGFAWVLFIFAHFL